MPVCPPLRRIRLPMVATVGKGGLFFIIVLLTCLLSATQGCAASASCTLPYGGLVSSDTAHVMARSSAYLTALSTSATELKQHKAVSLGLRHAPSRLALAAAVHRPSVSASSISAAMLPRGTVHVDINMHTPPRTLDARIRTNLPQTDMLHVRELLLDQMRQAAEEGSRLTLQAAELLSSHGQEGQQAVDERIHWLGQRLKALWLLDEALLSFQGTWQEPQKVLTLLQKAVDRDNGSDLAWASLGEVQLQLDQPLNALGSLHTALRLNAQQPRTLYIRALAHLRLQQPALAEADLNAALRAQPDNAAWLRARGAVRMVREDYAPMCQDFERACALGDCDGLAAARKRELCLPPKKYPHESR